MCRPIVKPGYDERDHKNNAPSKTMTMMESWRLLSTKNNFYNRNSAIHLSITSACSYTTLTKTKKKKQKNDELSKFRSRHKSRQKLSSVVYFGHASKHYSKQQQQQHEQ